MTPETCPDCGEDHEIDLLGEAVDEAADFILRLGSSTEYRLRKARAFHDMLRERILAEEVLH
jgi:hypothetical protein